MGNEALTKHERDTLVARIAELTRALYPPDPEDAPQDIERSRLKEICYRTLEEYFDRLPRLVLSLCPFTREPLKRTIDPFGLDGPWWHKERLVRIEEPRAPETFRVLLGALSLRGRVPSEATEEVLAGPEVPFVVPRLLGLPGMVAVIGQITLATGDLAYPIAYFSQEPIPPHRLHQHWLREDLWFEQNGQAAWTIANDTWDFDLAAYVRKDHLKWIRPGFADLEVLGVGSGGPCPYVDLPGERRPQIISGGEVVYGDLPDGSPVEPFAVE